MISRSAMDQHVSEGRARRWTREIGPDHLVIQAALLDGRWFIIPAGADEFQEASADVAAELTAGLTIGAGFDALIAGAITEAGRPRGAEASLRASGVETISRTEMALLVDAGQGERHPVAEAVRLEGRWWTVSIDEEVYRLASAEVDAEMDNTQKAMLASDEKVARARSALSP
jgi:hypothetical protein